MTNQPESSLFRRVLTPGSVWWRIAFITYALFLYVATHLPQVHVSPKGTIPLDKLAHVGAYALWTALAIGTRRPGRRVRPLAYAAVCCLVAILFAGFDEITQALPIVHRHAQWSDWTADVIGIVIVGVMAAVLCHFRAGSSPRI